MTALRGEITRMLDAWATGEPGAVDALMPLVYDELMRLARGQLARNPGAQLTLNTTDLVHEAYLKFVDQTRVSLEGRSHFFAIAARAMRQVLVDRARRRAAQKRGAGEAPQSLHESDAMLDAESDTVLALEQALTRLASHSDRCVQVVECRFFAGLTEEETARALGVSTRTVQRDWLHARGWLRQQLSPAHVARLSG